MRLLQLPGTRWRAWLQSVCSPTARRIAACDVAICSFPPR